MISDYALTLLTCMDVDFRNLIPWKFCFWKEIFAILRGNLSFKWIFRSFSYKQIWKFVTKKIIIFEEIFDHIPRKCCIFSRLDMCHLLEKPICFRTTILVLPHTFTHGCTLTKLMWWPRTSGSIRLELEADGEPNSGRKLNENWCTRKKATIKWSAGKYLS